MVAWDHLSDQPAHTLDKKYKAKIRRRHWDDLLISALTILLIYPLALLRYLFGFRLRPVSLEHFFGMAVNVDKEPEATPELLKELGCSDITIRIRMEEMGELESIRRFSESLQECAILYILIPAREHVENPSLLWRDATKVFETLSPFSTRFQVGNAVNRFKWGFVLPKEYLTFYTNIQKIRDSRFPHIKLLGPSVIDFEYHVTIRMLYNFFKIRYDAATALLYVDRRGAPENRQFIFDLRGKINLLSAIMRFSPKLKERQLYITETNWPIEGTGRYAPTSPTECIDETRYANYMVRYYLLAASTTRVATVYWHQMVAPGYGLIDNREGLRKRHAFKAYATMVSLLKLTRFESYRETAGTFSASFRDGTQRITALWRNGDTAPYTPPAGARILTMTGETLEEKEGAITLDDTIHYIIEETHG